MLISRKLVAVAASAAVLVGGTTAVTFVSSQSTSAPAVAVATPSTPPSTEVRVWADNVSYLVSLEGPTVAAALQAAQVTLSESDRVSPSLEATLTAGDVVTVSRVSVTQASSVVTLAFATTEVKDSSLAKGEKKVKTKGVNGERTDVVQTVTVDGQVESTNVISQTVTKEPVAQVVLVGTKAATTTVTSRSATRTAATTTPAVTPPSSGTAIDLSRADMWDRIAKCESGGNWAINTGNGYYGGLQFSLATWRGVKGTDFAAYPHQASRAEQITVANRLYAQRGLQPWGCRGAA